MAWACRSRTQRLFDPVRLEAVCWFLINRRHASSHLLDFPWTVCERDVFKQDPIVHRFVGMLLLRKALKQVNMTFDVDDFIAGVKRIEKLEVARSSSSAVDLKEAVRVFSIYIQTEDRPGLSSILGPALSQQFTKAFEKLEQRKQRIYLEVDSTRNFNIYGARFLFGEADPGDEEVVGYFGQKVILSRSEVDSLAARSAGVNPWLSAFLDGKSVGERALFKRIRFQFDVKFQSFERFFVHSSSDNKTSTNWIAQARLLHGDIDFLHCHHKLRLETPIAFFQKTAVDEYPLSWSIVDVDSSLEGRSEYLVSEKSNE